MNMLRYKRKSKKKKLILCLLLVGWMTLIYLKSAEPYQIQNIQPILSDWIPLSSIHNWLPHLEFYYDGDLFSWKEPYILIEFIMRKCAHIAEYAVLAVLWLLLINETTELRKYNFLISPFMVILYASSDEWHQSFIAGRTGHPIDVAVDCVGLLVAIIIIIILNRKNRNKGAWG
jgi:VanZ family protein